ILVPKIVSWEKALMAENPCRKDYADPLRNLGSRISLNISPNRLEASTAILTATPGKRARIGTRSMDCRPAPLSIPPQEGVRGGVPKPRKLSKASMRIALQNSTHAKHMPG